MVDIRPFYGYRYDRKKVDVSRAIFPPYELSDKRFREIFLRISDYNVIRIILGCKKSGKGAKYGNSNRLLNSWIEKGYLKRDGKPCIYVYSQEFESEGKKMERTGFISLVRLEKLGGSIMPHERTFHDQVIDMKALLERTRANPGPIFSIYSDPRKSVEAALEKIKRNARPDMETFTGYERVRHRLWKVDDEKTIASIAKNMKRRKLLIADGHHRYNISWKYSRSHPGDEEAKYMEMMMVNMENSGILIRPTHRLVKGIKKFEKARFLRLLGSKFSIEVMRFGKANEKEMLKKMIKNINARDWRSFGMYMGGREFYILRLKNECSMDIAKSHSKQWKRLGVNVLHVLVINGILAECASRPDERRNIEYIKDIFGRTEECVKRVESGECQMAFFMRPTKITEVKRVSGNREMMPQKSTCFYPKVYSGIVIYKFGGNCSSEF